MPILKSGLTRRRAMTAASGIAAASALPNTVDREGKFAGVFPPSTLPDRIAQVLKPMIGVFLSAGASG